MRIFSLLLVAAVAGCGSTSSTAKDMASPDLAANPADLAASTADLAGAGRFRYVTDRITLPMNKSEYARDLNGDNRPDNKLGDIVSTLASLPNGLDLQQQLDLTVDKGDGLNLFSLLTADPTLTEDPMVDVGLFTATPIDPPDFSGKGKFTIDKAVPAARLGGPLKMGAFESQNPRQQMTPATASLRIAISPTQKVTLPIVGAWLAFTPHPTNLTTGQLNGAITKKDVDGILVPSLARAFDEIASMQPCDPNCNTVRGLFDQDKDGHISLAELRNNNLVKSLLAPDLDLYDGAGKWKPNPSPSPTDAEKDSLSVGVAFHAVKAIFSE